MDALGIDKIEWISVKNRLPDNVQDVFVKLDCPECVIQKAFFWRGKFASTGLVLCDKHFDIASLDLFNDLVTHWIPYTEEDNNPIRITPSPPVTISWNWISIKNSLPPNDSEVLAYHCGNYSLMRYDRGKWHDEEFMDWSDDVTHWISLPPPPKD
jgi:hypothetical protein